MSHSPARRSPHGLAALTFDHGILFGGDYNPEQWPRETWREDVALMQRAGVNFVTVGVFSWAVIEPEPGVRDFAWLDEVLDLLHAAGIAVDLATPTASPPPWLGVRHPDILPVDPDGVRLIAGSRNQFAPASPVYRAHAREITLALAERYRDHPAVRMWHVGNEFGQLDHGDEAARAFRAWLAARYGTIDGLNAAWATTFWSQRYSSFDEILPPRRMPYHVNPTQLLDYRRYSSDELLGCYTDLRDAIRSTGATQPITTNFMGLFPHVDYRSWAGEVDVIADDQYPNPADPHAPADTALVQDLMRSLGDGEPWMLMEQAVSAVSWRGHNLPKSPARSRRDSLQAVARGADAVCFFQWRQSRAGAERFHSAMLPHSGADTEVFAGVVRQGAELARLREVVGATIHADVAIVFDWPSWWASDDPAVPTTRLRTIEQLTRWYRQLWSRGISADVVGPDADLSAYRVILLPHSYIVESHTAAALQAAATAGAHVVVGPFSGVADDRGHILQGRSPVLLRGLVGVSGEEWAGVPDAGYALRVDAPWAPVEPHRAPHEPPRAHVIAEKLRTDGAEVLVSFDEGPLAGRPALTRLVVGDGAAWYIGTVLPDALFAATLGEVLAEARVRGVVDPLPELVEAVARGPLLFILNHGDIAVDVPVPGARIDVLTGEEADGAVRVPAGDVRVLKERPRT